ncbi:uncharacterized protein RAG0_14518 [Rhynchosporium agropyri]|uniref:Uncharacterized protein n=1 Tax=Rhynchosporium agropyri TaxID=914238 RepID=A0A1E1LHC3_9HELO|nr:uncharacterized protein RAG0_14518 [Rhynchosporium agropyri]
MKLLILSLLISGAISAAVGGAGLKARASTACNCNIIFASRESVSTRNIPALPGKTQLNADYDRPNGQNGIVESSNACRVTWDRGQDPRDCSTWKQAAGPDGPNCPKSISLKRGRVSCYGAF